MSELPTPVGRTLRQDADVGALERVWKGVQRRRAERARSAPRARWIGGLAAAAALVMVFVLATRERAFLVSRDGGLLMLASGGELGSLAAFDASGREVTLSDGSSISLAPGAAIDPLENSPTAFGALVVRGRATFDVRPGGPRRWVLECGLATVEVVGTRFTIERSAHSVHVLVDRGVVLVRSQRLRDRVQRLRAGQSLELDDGTTSEAAPPTDEQVQPPVRAPERAPATSAVSAAPPHPAWRRLERNGDHAGAYAELGSSGIVSAAAEASVDDLLSLADVARLSGHPADAVVPLTRVISEHAEDPRAPLAAFTLGRLQLDALAHPALAADDFERALALGLPQSLQEDAYARLVEARSRAGDSTGAVAAAKEYESRFPAGKRLAEVRRRVGSL